MVVVVVVVLVVVVEKTFRLYSKLVDVVDVLLVVLPI